jgi:hypothetical protein
MKLSAATRADLQNSSNPSNPQNSMNQVTQRLHLFNHLHDISDFVIELTGPYVNNFISHFRLPLPKLTLVLHSFKVFNGLILKKTFSHARSLCSLEPSEVTEKTTLVSFSFQIHLPFSVCSGCPVEFTP